MAARILAALAVSLGLSLDEVHLSRETVRRNRSLNRETMSENIRDIFKATSPRNLTVHWDGKQMTAPENKYEKIDRLPVLVSGQDSSQLLGVPRLERGTGEAQTQAVYELLKEWGIQDKVCAMVFDTTASNTGSANGACILLEKLLGRNLLHLACRHHIFELLLKAAFESSMGCTSGPDVLIFKRFQGWWKNITKGEFSPGVHDSEVQQALHHEIADILAFTESQLKEKKIRKDYREFLELAVMFLGGTLIKGNKFRALGPIHHARWMAKAIYSLKIYLFRDQFHLTALEKSGLRDVCFFIVRFYQQAWFTATNPVSAPSNDLNLLKKLAANITVDSGICSKIYKAVLNKFMGHLWYLSEELIALAFFDDDVSIDCKRKMCEAIKFQSPCNDENKKKKIDDKDLSFIESATLDSFVTTNTMKFFEVLGLETTFLDSDPTTWQTGDDFIATLKFVKSLHVTNDIAERSVALVSEYNNLLTKNENGKQNAMLVAAKFRELASDYNKDSLKFSLSEYLNNVSMIPSSTAS